MIMLVPLEHVGVTHYAARATGVSAPPLSGPGPWLIQISLAHRVA